MVGPITYVVGFVVDDERQRVVLLQKTHPQWQKGQLNGVGGKLETNEFPVEAMEREFAEETGYKRKIHWRRFALVHGDGFALHAFVAFDRDAVKHARTTTDELIVIADPYNPPPSLVGNVRWLLPLALDPANPEATIRY